MTKFDHTTASPQELTARKTRVRAAVLALTVLTSTFTLPMSAAQAIPGCKHCCIVICV